METIFLLRKKSSSGILRPEMGRKQKKLAASPAFVRFLQLTLGRWLRWKFRLSTQNRHIPATLQPPYIVIPNHVGFWDPFQIGLPIPHPIHYVVADANFRSPVLRFLLGLVGSIPITKSMSDRDAVKLIMDVRRTGGVLCLFAEGRRTWDGRTLPVIPSTAKLIKLLKIPVLTPVLEGAYFSHPCWAVSIRRGRLNIRFEKLFDGPELRSMSAEDIHASLSSALQHDEHEWQSRHLVRFKSSRRAEMLERVLYMCDSCTTIGAMESSGNTIHCTACGAVSEMDEYGAIIHRHAAHTTTTIADWNDRQRSRLRDLIRQAHEHLATSAEGTAIFSDAPVRLFLGSRRKPLVKIGSGKLSMYADRVEYLLRPKSLQRAGTTARGLISEHIVPAATDDGNIRLVFPLPDVSGVSVQNHERLEWYFRRRLYHFRSFEDRLSGYKWYSAIHMAREFTGSIDES